MIDARVTDWVKGRSRVVGSVVRTTSEHAVLTYDDGPDPDHTGPILGTLARHRATATFFVLLTRARRFRSIVDDIVAEGHEVALHGPDHRPLTDFGYAEARRRTQDARAELEDQVGCPVQWFRPPYGRQSLRTWQATRSAGLVPVMWSATTWDWREVGQDQRLAEAVRGAAPGMILLAHDGFAGMQDGAAEEPVPVVDRAGLTDLVLTAYRERALSCVSLGRALTGASPVLAASFSGGLLHRRRRKHNEIRP